MHFLKFWVLVDTLVCQKSVQPALLDSSESPGRGTQYCHKLFLYSRIETPPKSPSQAATC